MVIDAHMHLMEHIAAFCAKGEGRPIGNGSIRFATGEVVRMVPPGMGEYGFSAESCIELMNRNGIDMSVLLQSGYYGFQNEYVAEVAKKYPKRFFPVGGLDPYCQQKEQILSNLIDNMGIRALKFEMSQTCGIVSYHPDFQINGPEMKPIFERADQEKMAIAFDIGGPGQTSYQIEQWGQVIRAYPDVHFIVCHLLVPKKLDQPGWAEELSSLAEKNTWFDFSSIPYNNPESYPYPTSCEIVKRAAGLVGADRLLWGSDAPYVLNYETYPNLKDYIAEAGIFSDAELKGMMGDNAREAYRI